MAHDPALRRHIDARLAVLKRQRHSWEPGYRELSRFINPRRGQFWSQPNQGGRGAQANSSILDPTALFALRTLVAGLMSGVTSPARPWFRLTIADRRVASLAPVKVWLDECAERMRMVFNSGNLYSALPMMYEELGQFGTGCAIVEFDREDVIRLYTLSTGEYWLGLDWRGRVDTMARRFMYSYRQIESRWPEHGIPEITEKARGADADSEIALLHMIEPNTAFEKGRLDWAGKKFRSVYWRDGGGLAEGEFIHRGGYSEFPVLTPRWAPIGNDAYSKGPGHDALPDVKSLQILKKTAQKLIDYTVNRDKEIARAVNEHSAASWTKQATEWRATAEKEFSPEALGNARTALAQVFDRQTITYLESLGFTNHPGLIRGMVKVANTIKDDSFVGGNAGRGNGAMDPKSLYPNSQHN